MYLDEIIDSEDPPTSGGDDTGAGDADPSVDYFGSPEYQALSAADKLDKLWDEHQASKVGKPDAPADFKWAQFPETFLADGNVSFTHTSDVLPPGRTKTQHTQGLLAKARWVPKSS